MTNTRWPCYRACLACHGFAWLNPQSTRWSHTSWSSGFVLSPPLSRRLECAVEPDVRVVYRSGLSFSVSVALALLNSILNCEPQLGIVARLMSSVHQGEPPQRPLCLAKSSIVQFTRVCAPARELVPVVEHHSWRGRSSLIKKLSKAQLLKHQIKQEAQGADKSDS